MTCLSSMPRLLSASGHILEPLSIFTLLFPLLSCLLFRRHMRHYSYPFFFAQGIVLVGGINAFSELFNLIVFKQLLQILVNLRLLRRTLLAKLTQFLLLLIPLFLKSFQFVTGLARLFLNTREEVYETLGVILKELLWATESHLSHIFVFHKLGYFFVLCFNHMLHKEHFSLLFDKLPSRFSIFWPLHGNVHSSGLRHLDFTLDFRVNRESAGLDLCLTELTKTPFAHRSILFPDSKLFFWLALRLPLSFLIVFERKNHVVSRCPEGIDWLCISADIGNGISLGHSTILSSSNAHFFN